MENERVLIATDYKTLKSLLVEMFNPNQEAVPDIELDMLSRQQSAEIAGISIPTLDKQIKLGKFKQYSMGRKKYMLKSELLEALRNNL